MEWMQLVFLVLAMAGMFFWNRTEARADARHFDNETKALRREMIDVMRSSQASIEAIKEEGKEFRERWNQESKEFRERWYQESKDFHGRLCSIEERRSK